MSVLKDVRLHCLDCCCGIASEVKIVKLRLVIYGRIEWAKILHVPAQ